MPLPPRQPNLHRDVVRGGKRTAALERRGPGPWHKVGDPGEPAFQNSWAAEGGGALAPQFRQTLGAGPEIQGAFTGGAYGTVAFTLPVGYRPLDGTLYLAGSDINSNPITFKVETNGNVTILAGSIPDGSVTTVKIADGAVTTAKLADSGVTAGAYGDASHVAAVTVDAKGRITAAASTAIAIAEAAVTGLVADLAAKLGLSVFTTKGDIVIATGAGTVARLGVGANTQVLTADSTQASGVKWAAAGGGGASSPLTTKGDIWGYSSADARIPVGTNGQVLTADSAQTLGLKWAAAPSAAFTRVFDSTLGANAASIDTGAAAIPATFEHLRITCSVRSVAAAAFDQLAFQINGDTVAHYIATLLFSGGGAPGGAFGSTINGLYAECPGATAPANYFGTIVVDIACYAKTDRNKSATISCAYIRAVSSGNVVDLRVSAHWPSTAAINQIALVSQGGSNLLAGSAMTIEAY
jgi:hypothetical protein